MGLLERVGKGWDLRMVVHNTTRVPGRSNGSFKRSYLTFSKVRRRDLPGMFHSRRPGFSTCFLVGAGLMKAPRDRAGEIMNQFTYGREKN